jgi:hypothetical protein
MASFARWNRRYHVIEIDLPGSPVQRSLSIDVKFTGTGIIKRLMIDRYASSAATLSPVKSFCSCPAGSATTVLAPGTSGRCGIIGPPKDAEPDMVILTPGFQATDCPNMGPLFLPFDFWQIRETYFAGEPGGVNMETAIWELTDPATSDTIIITIVIEDNAAVEPGGTGSLPQ